MVKVGVCVFARALASAGDIPEIVGWVAIIDAVVTMLFGFLMYLPQKDMKRLLAFSTIAQLAYVFFGLGLSVFGSQMAFNGAVEHIFNHAFTKTLFFLIAGSLSFTLGTRMLPKIQGLMKKYPVTAWASRSPRPLSPACPHEHVLLQVPDYFRWLRGWCFQHGHLRPRVRHGRRDRRHLRMVPALDG